MPITKLYQRLDGTNFKRIVRREMAKKLEDLSVLVVDDNEIARDLMIKILERLGVRQIKAAVDGKIALSLLSEADEEIDVVLSDWQMPNMDGLELLNQARLLKPQINFIMVTGKRKISVLQSAVNSEVTDFIYKPFTPKQLAQKLRNMKPPPPARHQNT